jgi:hypothetical protein
VGVMGEARGGWGNNCAFWKKVSWFITGAVILCFYPIKGNRVASLEYFLSNLYSLKHFWICGSLMHSLQGGYSIRDKVEHLFREVTVFVMVIISFVRNFKD